MFATQLELGTDVRADYRVVRWELFVFHEVRDVLAGSHPGSVVVLHEGTARVDEWRAELKIAGLIPDPPPGA